MSALNSCDHGGVIAGSRLNPKVLPKPGAGVSGNPLRGGGDVTELPSTPTRKAFEASVEPPVQAPVVSGALQPTICIKPSPRRGVSTMPTALVRFHSREYPARITVW